MASLSMSAASFPLLRTPGRPQMMSSARSASGSWPRIRSPGAFVRALKGAARSEPEAEEPPEEPPAAAFSWSELGTAESGELAPKPSRPLVRGLCSRS